LRKLLKNVDMNAKDGGDGDAKFTDDTRKQIAIVERYSMHELSEGRHHKERFLWFVVGLV